MLPKCYGQDLDWEEEAEKDDRNEANKHFEYYMMALVEGPKVRLSCGFSVASWQTCGPHVPNQD